MRGYGAAARSGRRGSALPDAPAPAAPPPSVRLERAPTGALRLPTISLESVLLMNSSDSPGTRRCAGVDDKITKI